MTLSLLLRFDGADGSSTFTDTSPSPKTVTASGGAVISTTQSKFGGASASFNGTSTHLSIPAHADFGVGTGDFCADAWIFANALADQKTIFGDFLWSYGYQGGWCIRVMASGAVSLAYDGNVSIWETQNSASGVLTTGAWNHIEVSRSSGVQRVFVNGVKVIEFTNTKDYGSGSRIFRFGTKFLDGVASHLFNGYVDDFVFQKGVAGHSADFTPSLTAFVTDFAQVYAQVRAPLASVFGGANMAATVRAPTLQSFSGWRANVSASIPAPKARSTGKTGVQNNVKASVKAPTAIVLSGVVVAASVPKVTAQATATVHERAIVAAVMPKVTAQATGTVGIVAVVSATAPKVTARALGGATVSAAIKAPVVSASATKWIAAVVSARMPKVTARALGGGTVEASIKAPVAAVSATVGIVARVVATIPKTAAKATGSPAQFARIVASVPAPKAVQRAWVVATMPKVLAKASASAVIAITREAWAINLQAPADGVAAATHYTGFPFNQIVRLQGSYYGVASDGIYLLGGDTDNGEPIPWAIKTTPTDYGVIQHKRLNSAYIGARMGSQAAVLVHLGEAGQESYTYRNERGPSAQTHLQRFGKGLCSRYYALGISDASGGEFELDSIDSEAIPLSRAV